MSISVIVPSKDRLRHLKRFLPLYLREKEVAEVIVVVDGSTDGSIEYLQKLSAEEPRFRVLDNGINRGIPYTKNRGIDAASSDYIFIAEDDLEITPGFFKTLLTHLERSNADIICGRNIFRYETESAKKAIARTDKIHGPVINKKTIEINTSARLPEDIIQNIIAAPMLAKRSIFNSVRFDERYKVNFWREETDFQFSAQEAGYRLMSCPHAICYNYMIENDRSGVHTTVGLRRTKWIIINNWHFINKHHQFIAGNFEIGNRFIYITRFVAIKLTNEVIIPTLVKWKRRMLPQSSVNNP
jgi:GT2 family glycosyltransferase